MRYIWAALLAALLAGPGFAEPKGIIRQEAAASVMETTERLAAAMQDAGLTVFTRVDHGAGAAGVGLDIGDSQLLIFGNPKVGSQAMQDDPLAGLFLPMKVLIYEDAAGGVMIAYEDPMSMLARLDGVDADAEYLKTMSGALARFIAGVAR